MLIFDRGLRGFYGWGIFNHGLHGLNGWGSFSCFPTFLIPGSLTTDFANGTDGCGRHGRLYTGGPCSFSFVPGFHIFTADHADFTDGKSSCFESPASSRIRYGLIQDS